MRRCRLLAQQVPDVALEHCERALREDSLSSSQRADVYIGRAVAWRTKNDGRHALEALDQALRLKPDSADARLMRAVARQHLGDNSGALADFNDAIRLRPEAGAYGARGDLRRRQGDLDAAIADYGESIRLAPQKAFGYRVRAAALLERGDFDAAVADCEQAITREARTPAALRRLGIAQFLAGRFDSSAQSLSRTIELDPADRYAQLWRYLALRRQGRPGAAQAELERADAALKDRKWPAPLFRVLIEGGPMPAEAAQDPSAQEAAQGRCDAEFFVGEKMRGAGAAPDSPGVRLLQSAQRDCAAESYAAIAARAELRRMSEAPRSPAEAPR